MVSKRCSLPNRVSRLAPTSLRQHLPLRLVWPVRETLDRLPVPQPGVQHPGAEDRALHGSAYRLNGARIIPRNVFG